MNKKMTLLLLCVVACAMVIVMFSQLQLENTSTNSPVKTNVPFESVAKSEDIPNIVISTLPPTSNASKPKPNTIMANSKPTNQTPNLQQLNTSEAKDPVEELVAANKSEETQPKPQTAKQNEGNRLLTKNQTQTSQQAVKKDTPKEAKKVDSPAPMIPVSEKKTGDRNVTVRDNQKKPLLIPNSDITHGVNGKHDMKAITVKLSGAKVIFRFEAKDTFAYKTMSLTGPNRLVIDFPGTWGTITPPVVPLNRLVEKMRIGNQPAGPRIVLDLKVSPKKYELFKVNNSIIELVLE